MARCLVLAALLLLGCVGTPAGPDAELRLFLARKVVTMEPGVEGADAVAVADGRILAVGSRAVVEAALAGRPHVVDTTFADKVLLPGFIDPHLHPWIVAAILPLEIVSAMEWQTPLGRSQAVRGRDNFLEALRQRDAALPAGEWLVVWGYHAPYHGRLSRHDLDAISRERPVVVWQRSIHELYFNSRALDALGLTRADFAKTPHGSWDQGHLYETGIFVAEAMLARLLEPRSFARGLALMSQVLHRGGITTIGDQGFPAMNLELELGAMRAELAKDVPYRYVIVPNGMTLSRTRGSVAGGLEAARELLALRGPRLRVVRHVKYLADGAMFSQLMQLTEPYLDGHVGAWLMQPTEQAALLDAFWRDGWDVHIHVNGDAGLDAVLDAIEAQQRAVPRDDVRVVLEHYGYAREDQHARVGRLGVAVSANPWYLHELAPPYATHGLGPERARNLAPLGGLARAGVPFSLHSDAYMAPAEPLTLAWVAANRIASDGRVWGPEQRVPLELALRAITLEAARSLGLEDEIGSLAPGKRADFTVLERDPYAVPLAELNRIPIWGTVFEGRLYPLDQGRARLF